MKNAGFVAIQTDFILEFNALILRKLAKPEEYRKADHELFEVSLTSNEEISPGVHLISWKRTHNFSPGQVVKISTEKAVPPRIYSICSGNQEDEIRVLFNVKDEGILTPKLSGMIPRMKDRKSTRLNSSH